MNLLDRFSRLTASWSWLGFAYLGFALYLLAPLAIIILMSFKDGPFLGFPIESWTLDWYRAAFEDTEFLGALGLSVYIAVMSTAIATVVGVWAATILAGHRFFGWTILFALICMPLIVPAIVSAISMRMFLQTIGIRPGTLAIVLAHSLHSVPYIGMLVLTRLNSMPRHLTEAARDLGADPFVAYLRVTVPFLLPALIGGAVFAMLSSFDDFIRSFFLGSYAPTLPVLLYNRMRIVITPQIAAISTMVLVATVFVGFFAERFVRQVGAAR